MKKQTTIIALVFCLLMTAAMLTGCADAGGKVSDGGAVVTGSDPIADTTTTTAAQEDDYLIPALTMEQTLDMGNLMNCSWFVREDDYDLCGRAFVNDVACFVRNPSYIYDYTLIVENCAPYALSIYDGDYYFIDAVDRDRFDALYRCTPDGELTFLAEDVEHYSIWEDKIFYSDNTSRLLHVMDLNGSKSREFSDTRMDYPYAVNGWVIYSSLDDNMCLHAMRIKDKYDLAITGEWGDCPIIEGTTLWYTNMERGCIASVNLHTGEQAVYTDLPTYQDFYLTETSLYYINAGDDPETYMDDIPMVIPRGDGRFDIEVSYRLGIDDNCHKFRYATEFFYVMVDYTSDWEYIEEYRGVNDYYDGDMIYWLDLADRQ